MTGITDDACEVGTFRVPAEHPALPGHFPGQPVVPGVVLLDEVLALITARYGGAATSLSAVRFTSVVTPDQTIAVQCSRRPSGEIGFICLRDGRAVASGRITLRPPVVCPCTG
jgi:3-hydroxyacyl-[acyl-carrier-protein] dehydratase